MSMELYDEAAMGAIRETLPELDERLSEAEARDLETDEHLAQAMASCAIGFGEGGVETYQTISVETGDDGLASFNFQGDPICFFSGVAFHPGAQKDVKNVQGSKVADEQSGESRLFVLDTGWLDSETGSDVASDSYLRAPLAPGADLNLGHGPAILDLARTIMGKGSEARMVLREPDYFGGALQATTFMPAFENGKAVGFVRFFDSTAAVRALNRLFEEHSPRTGDVLSLSFGTTDPKGEARFARAIAAFRSKGVHVVAAAGNVRAPNRQMRSKESWPAALPGVMRVGSGSHSNPDDFSAIGTWISHFANGSDVPVDIPGLAGPSQWPDPSGDQGARSATWSGTSFATPIVAAMIARNGLGAVSGNQIDHSKTPDWQP